MSDITVDPYLFFKGQAKEAMEFYKDIFGGELTLQAYSDVPDMDVDENKKDWLMHAALRGGEITLLASDTDLASPSTAKIELSLSGSDEIRLREIFGKLSVDGKVKSPLKKEFWGDIFGNLTDKYGVDWMINITAPES